MTPAPPVPDEIVQNDAVAGVAHEEPPRPKTTPMKVLKAFVPLGIFVALVLSDIPVCPTKNFFGIPCPGCGLTRATEALVVGDLLTMLRMHPLAPIITPLAVWGLIRTTLVSAGLISGLSKDPAGKIPKWFWATLGVALIGLWLARMFGYLGGHPDDVDFSQGWIAQGFTFVADFFRG